MLTKRHPIRCMLLGLLWTMSQPAHSAVLGSFANVENLPGYIDLDPRSPWYKGPISPKAADDGIERRTPAQLIDAFFPDGTLSLERMQALEAEAEKMRRNAFIAFCMEKLPADAPDNHYCLGEVTDEKLLAKWEKKEVNVVLKYVGEELTRARQYGRNLTRATINTPAAEPFLSSFFGCLNILETIRGEDYQRGKYDGANRIVAYNIKNLFVTVNYTIKNDREEAANLLVPASLRQRFPGQRFLSRSDLRLLQEQGYDLANLEPMDSGMWRKPNTAIRKYDTTRYNGQSLDYLTETMGAPAAAKFLDPQELVDVVYMPEKFGSGATPKLYGKIGDDKWKVKYLTDKVGAINTTNVMNVIEMLINSAEVNVENAVNNLAAAMGFTVDPTYYKQKVRLFFADEIYAEDRFEEAYKDMVAMIEENYGKSMYVASAMQNIKVDEATGRRYIELRGVNLERKGDPDHDRNLGLFERHGLGKAQQREHRAFALFLAWIGDIDPKNENVRLKLIPTRTPTGEMRYKIAYSNSDMGAGLGVGLPNYLSRQFVNDVKWDEQGKTKALSFEYRKIYPLPVMDAISLDDARWLARRMGQFTLEQLYTTFAAAGFPDVIAQVFAQKMMGRRNQLLEALGMIGQEVLDDEGRPLILERGQEFAGSIPGYERLFKDGLVTDPDNELFDPERDAVPRYWGTYWNGKVKDKPQTIFWRHMGLRVLNEGTLLLTNFLEPGAFLTGAGPTFTGLQIYRTSPLFSICNESCFFQGVGLGVGTFAPFRFVVDNPDPESRDPFLIVDMFRIGVYVGGVNREIEETLGLDLPTGSGLGIGGRFFKVYEFMKIRAVPNLDDYVSTYKEGLKSTPRLMFEKAKQQFVESMEPGDSMVLSTYVGLQGRLRYAPFREVALVSPQIKLKGEATMISRVTLHKEDAATILANWSKINMQRGQIEAGIRAGLRIDLASIEGLRRNQKEDTYSFNWDVPHERDFLMQHLHASYPKNVPMTYSIAQRSKRIKQHRFDAGFFTMAQQNRVVRRTELDLLDYLTGATSKELSYEKAYLNSYMKGLNTRTRGYSFKAGVNEGIDPYVRVRLDIALPEAHEKDFLKTLNRISPLVADDFIVFEPEAVKEYMGTLSFLGTTVFPRQALDILFERTPQEICAAYLAVNDPSIPASACAEPNKVRVSGLRSLLKGFHEAQRSYKQLMFLHGVPPFMLHAENDQIFKLLRSFADWFSRHSRDHQLVKVVKLLVPKSAFYQQAVLRSSLNGFPNDDDEIELSKPNRGEFKPTLRHLADTPEEVYQLFSDQLHLRVQRFFFSPIASLTF